LPSFSFHKEERLKSRKVISRLFKEGKSIKSYPLRVVWTEIEPPRGEFPIQFTQTVPRRSFTKAYQRNLLRRRIREAFRLNKNWLYKNIPENSPQYGLMVIYIAKETLPFDEIEKATQKWMKTFIKNIT
jgi:ribonuclease P protein component